MPAINLTDDELVAVAAAIRRAIETDRFPHVPRLDPLRSALVKLEPAITEANSAHAPNLRGTAPKPPPDPKASPPAKADERARG
jgi:hypothetical protein